VTESSLQELFKAAAYLEVITAASKAANPANSLPSDASN
jgi:hypothetical protein